MRDTGSGIDPAVLPRIFEPWVTTKSAGRGTGLGLSITRDLITSLGGTIARLVITQGTARPSPSSCRPPNRRSEVP